MADPERPRRPAHPPALETSVRKALAAVVGERHVLVADDLTAGFSIDWTGRFRGRAAAVVRPATTGEVAGVLEVCRTHRVAVVPQGGNTGLVGGGVPLGGELVLSLRRLDGLGEVDRAAAQVTAGAGVTLVALQRRANGAGLAFAVDLAARDSATVGGMIATNAGGVHVLRYGAMRAQVVGIEAVLGDGATVSHLQGLVKDNTGYDLSGLLVGSEGTLGVVTAARLRLVARHDRRVVAVLGLRALDDAMTVLARLRSGVDSLEAVEVMFAEGVGLVADRLGTAAPPALRAPVSLLVECAAHHDPAPELAGALSDVEPLLVGEPAVAEDEARRRDLWRYRELHADAINALGPPVKLDVSLPSAALAPFVAEVGIAVAAVAPSARTIVFGHLGDGNLHVNVVGVVGSAVGEEQAERVEEVVLRLVAAYRGSISAEHGIGSAKRAWLHLSRTPEEIAAFRAVKAALDPGGLLNPGVLLPQA